MCCAQWAFCWLLHWAVSCSVRTECPACAIPLQGLAQMNNLRDLVFIGDLRASAPYSSPLSAQPSASLAAAGGDPGTTQAAADRLMDLGRLVPTSRLNRGSGGASSGGAGSGGSRGSGSGGGGGAGSGGSDVAGSPVGSGVGLARGSVLSMLQGLQGLQTLVLEQWPDHMPGAGELSNLPCVLSVDSMHMAVLLSLGTWRYCGSMDTTLGYVRQLYRVGLGSPVWQGMLVAD